MPEANTLTWQTMLTPEFSEHAKQQGLFPETVAPAVAWLAHERCRVDGITLESGAGSIYELVISQTKRTPADHELSIETVDSRLEAVLDRTGMIECALPAEVSPLPFTPKPYDPKPRS